MQLTKVAKTRLRLLHKNVLDLGGRVERKELTVINFILTVIPRLAEKILDKNDEQLKIANDALLYLLRRRGDIDKVWLIDLFQRHGNLAHMSGRMQRFPALHAYPAEVRLIDRPALVSELERVLNADPEQDRKGRSSTLFDKSIKGKTMQASKFAK
jgi:hypothetical protein